MQRSLAGHVRTHQPDAGIAQAAQGSREVGDLNEGDMPDRAARHLAHHRGNADGAVPGDDHRMSAGGVRGTQAGAEVVRVLHAVKHQQQGIGAGLRQQRVKVMLGKDDAGRVEQGEHILMAFARGTAVELIGGGRLERDAVLEGQRTDLVQSRVTRLLREPQGMNHPRTLFQHPEHGMVPPGEFIALAEDTGLIVPLGLWVMETALRQQAQWRNTPTLAHLTVAINVSARQFHQDDFVTQVLNLLHTTGADPTHIKLELTESLLLKNVDSVITTMRALRAYGLGFSLDDFGTGYSSLSYLKRLPLDQIKIDQGFVRDALVDPNDAAIARSIIALAGSLGLSVIAEGVETEAHHQFLLYHGCKAFQGYFFGRPMAQTEFETLALQTHHPSPQS